MNEPENESTIISELQFRLLQPCDGKEVCELAASAIYRLAGDAIVATSMLDEQEQTMRTVAVKGFDVSMEKIIDLFGMDISAKSLKLSEMTPDELRTYRSGRLEKIDGGLFPLVERYIPKQACAVAEKFMGVQAAYVMGFIHGQEHLGGLFILSRNDIVSRIEIIERAANIAAISLQRARAEANLRASEEKYRSLVDNSHEAIIVAQDGMLKFVNRRTVELTGLSDDDLLSKPFPVFIHPDDRKLVAEYHTKRLKGEEVPFRYAFRLATADGSDRWVETSATLIEWKGRPASLNFMADITERKQAEEALCKSEQRYRTVADFTYDWETWIAPDGRVLYCSPSVMRITGYTAAEITADPGLLLRMVHPSDRGTMVKHYTEELSDENRSFHFDYRIINAQGQTRWVSHYCVPVHDENHVYLGRRGSTRDVTKRIKMEESLAESEKRFRQLFEQTGTANALFDRDCRLILQNSMSKEFLPAGEHGAIGKNALELFGPDTGKSVTERMHRVMDSGNPETFETLFNLPTGQKWFRSSYQPLLDADKKVFGVQVISQDITELKKAQEISQRAEKLESLGLLAGGIAHDFNNLLGGIYGYIDMAQEKAESGSKVEEYLKKAVKTFVRARDLTQQLLTFSKGGAPDRKPGSLAPLLQESVHFALSGSKTSASFNIAGDLWTCDFDENQMNQVVNNIVLNASQAMPTGGKVFVSAVNIELKAGESTQLKPGRYVKVAIRDTGPGIPPGIMPRIFDPFFTTKQKGSGLGLATSYSIIKRHDGEISVDSAPDKGATFTLFLPASGNNLSTAATEDTAAAHKGTGTILVLDDEESIRETVGGMLKSMGYRVVYAQTGEEALKKVKSATGRKKNFRAIIMDLTIPGGMGGKETIEELRKTDSHTPVFVASGYSDDPVMADPARYGFTDRIKKPFRRSNLSELLRRNLE